MFTDNDLKRLKDEACSVHPTACRPWIIGNELNALIARLEAAEKVIYAMYAMDDCIAMGSTIDEHNSCVDAVRSATETWQQAAGKCV